MITKILFTAMVILAVIVYARHRTARRPPERPADPPRPAPWYWRLIPAGMLVAALGVGALVFWLEWQEEHRVFTLRVVDTRSGEVRTYPVYPDDVEGRRFTTVDGRRVTLADVERMELLEGAPEDTDGSAHTP
jgi:hypothetical protein